MGRDLLISILLLAGAAFPSATIQHAPDVAARATVERWLSGWCRARLALDAGAIAGMLPTGFEARIGPRVLLRDEYIAWITTPPAGMKLTRCDAAVLTVQRAPNGWVSVLEQKLEFQRPGHDGRANRIFSLWVVRDTWAAAGGALEPVLTEILGNQAWRDGARPPFPDWAASSSPAAPVLR